MKVLLLKEVDYALAPLGAVNLEARPCVDDTIRVRDAQYVVKSVVLLHDPEAREHKRLKHHVLAVVRPSAERDVAALSALLAAF